MGRGLSGQKIKVDEFVSTHLDCESLLAFSTMANAMIDDGGFLDKTADSYFWLANVYFTVIAESIDFDLYMSLNENVRTALSTLTGGKSNALENADDPNAEFITFKKKNYHQQNMFGTNLTLTILSNL